MYDVLRAQLDQSVYHAGEQIPTELELSRQYGVSRITVKQAIQKLVMEGRLYRIQGKGTFVSRPRLSRKLKTMASFTEELSQRNLTPSVRLLQLEVVVAPAKVATALQLPENASVILLRRLRLADQEPMGIQTAYLPYADCSFLLGETDQLSQGSLYAVLERHRLRPVAATEEYSVALIDGADAQLLNVPAGSAAFWVERTSYLPSDRPLEFVESVLRADRYTLHVELQGG